MTKTPEQRALELATVRQLILQAARSFPSGITAQTLRVTLAASGYELPIEDVVDHLRYLVIDEMLTTREHPLSAGLVSYHPTAKALKSLERAG